MQAHRILLVLGGTYHDFDGFAATLTPVLARGGAQVEATYELNRLHDLGDVDVVILYTCLSGPTAEAPDAAGIDEGQARSLAEWVASGGGLLTLHAATVSARNNPTLRGLMGGAFESHPPQFAFTVYPMYGPHPITEGIEAFTVHDEFYIQIYEPDVAIHMVAMDRGLCHPMVWSKGVGQGRVAHIALGHGPAVWSLPAYQQLVGQAVGWLGERRG